MCKEKTAELTDRQLKQVNGGEVAPGTNPDGTPFSGFSTPDSEKKYEQSFYPNNTNNNFQPNFPK